MGVGSGVCDAVGMGLGVVTGGVVATDEAVGDAITVETVCVSAGEAFSFPVLHAPSNMKRSEKTISQPLLIMRLFTCFLFFKSSYLLHAFKSIIKNFIGSFVPQSIVPSSI